MLARANWWWGLAAGLLLAATLGLAFIDDPLAGYPAWIAWVGLGTLGWAVAWVRAAKGDALSPALLWGVAIALRLGLLVPEVPLSDDLYRYLWDGRVGAAGTNPFVFAPSDDALAHLRDEAIWPNVNHPEVPTIYPPVAQFYFRVLEEVAPHAKGPRLFSLGFDLASLAALLALLRRRGENPALAAVFAWSPLVALESAAGGHVDAWGVALLLLALAWVPSSGSVVRATLAGFVYGASVWVKPVGVFLAPAVLARWVTRGRLWFIVGGGVSLATFWPLLDAGERLFTGFTTYADHWRFNDAFYSPLIALGLEPRPARAVLAALLLLVSVLAPWRERDALGAAAIVAAAILWLSPTVHPWYAVWLVALLPFASPRLRFGLGWLAAALPIAYVSGHLELVTGEWIEPPAVKALLWGGAALATTWGLTRRA